MRQSQHTNTRGTKKICGNANFHVRFAIIRHLAHISVDIAFVISTRRVLHPSQVPRRGTDSSSSARLAVPDNYQNHHHLQPRTPNPVSTTKRHLTYPLKTTTKGQTKITTYKTPTQNPTYFRSRMIASRQDWISNHTKMVNPAKMTPRSRNPTQIKPTHSK